MIYAVVLSIIVAVLLGTAVVRSLTVKNQADFLVAGRKLTWPVLVFTLLSSWIGAGSLFAGAENAYRNGFSALWQPAGGWFGLALIAVIAGRARRFAQFTVPDLLETRYNTAARVLATIAIVISYTMITSYQFKGGGDILHLIFPSLDQTTGMYIIAAFVITFTALAGMASVAYLDLIIGLLVTVIALISLPLLLARTGGWPAAAAGAPGGRAGRARRFARRSFHRVRTPRLGTLPRISAAHPAAADRQPRHVPEILLRTLGTRRPLGCFRMDRGHAGAGNRDHHHRGAGQRHAARRPPP
jgi:Na+/proline symporter